MNLVLFMVRGILCDKREKRNVRVGRVFPGLIPQDPVPEINTGRFIPTIRKGNGLVARRVSNQLQARRHPHFTRAGELMIIAGRMLQPYQLMSATCFHFSATTRRCMRHRLRREQGPQQEQHQTKTNKVTLHTHGNWINVTNSPGNTKAKETASCFPASIGAGTSARPRNQASSSSV